MSRYWLVAACWLALISCSDSKSNPGGDDDDDSPVVGSTYGQVQSVAKQFYDAVQAGEDMAPYIEATLGAFRIPVFENDDIDGPLARINAGKTFVTKRVVAHMAEAFTQGLVIEVEGYGAGLEEQHVGLAFPYNQAGGGDVIDIIGVMLYSSGLSNASTPDVHMESRRVLPTFVHALGQERAKHTNPSATFVDPVWGDGRLDPLQFVLLNATIFAKPSRGTKTSTQAVTRGLSTIQSFGLVDFIVDQLAGEVTSEIQDTIEVPLDEKDAAKVSVCGSLILYGHKVTMTNTPVLLWHAPKTPNITSSEMLLTFEDDYFDNWASAVIGEGVSDLTGCTFPRKGPIEGKTVKWSVSDALEDHGSYNFTQTKTDVNGKAIAAWKTITDSIPPTCQDLEHQRDAVGATETVVSGLLPGWSGVETAVNFLNPNTGGQGNAPLTVLYYKVDSGDPCHNE